MMFLIILIVSAALLVAAVKFGFHRFGPFGIKSPLECIYTKGSQSGIDIHLIRPKEGRNRTFEFISDECRSRGYVPGQEEDIDYTICNSYLPVGISIYFQVGKNIIAVHTGTQIPHEKEILGHTLTELPNDDYSFYGVISADYARDKYRKPALRQATP